MNDRRRLLKIMAGLAATLLLPSCKHSPEGQYDRRDGPNRDGGDGGGY